MLSPRWLVGQWEAFVFSLNFFPRRSLWVRTKWNASPGLWHRTLPSLEGHHCPDTLPTMVHPVKAMVFPVVLYGWELDYKESWALKNWCFWTAVLEKTLESPLDCKEIQLVHPKGNQSWIFTGRTNAEAGTIILWPTDAKTWLIWKKTMMLGMIEGGRRRGHEFA